LDDDDYLVGVQVVSETSLILSISEQGFGKRTALTNYRLTSRGGKGVINMKTSAKTGKVVGILSLKEDSDLMIISKEGKIIRLEASEIRQVGRSTQGVRLVRLEGDDRVAAACVVPEAENGDSTKPDDQQDLPLQ
jgi:DNA gyrase subunit A